MLRTLPTALISCVSKTHELFTISTDSWLRRGYRRLHMVDGRTWNRYHSCQHCDSTTYFPSTLVATWLRTTAIIRYGTTTSFTQWEIQ
jgi:hypothetical protein